MVTGLPQNRRKPSTPWCHLPVKVGKAAPYGYWVGAKLRDAVDTLVPPSCNIGESSTIWLMGCRRFQGGSGGMSTGSCRFSLLNYHGRDGCKHKFYICYVRKSSCILLRYPRNHITTKMAFIVTLLVAALTIVSIWLFGLGRHRTIFVNSLLSTTILSIAFFLFLAIGLYKGSRLKDNIGKITDKIKRPRLPDIGGIDLGNGSLDFGDGCGEAIWGILAWILFTILLLLFIWLFGALLWTLILVFAAMLYWIFFRAVRLVFKNSNKCRGDLGKSVAYGVGYTLLYNFWIYGIILATHYLMM